MTARPRSWWQKSRLHSWYEKIRSWFGWLWQKIKQHPVATGVVVVLVLILFIFSAYRFDWDWTGFNSGTSQITITSTSKTNYSASVSQPSKSLWDWLQLLAVLAIPIVVGLGAAWFTAQQGKVSDRENTENQREAALQAYIDKISELLLHEQFGESVSNPKVESIARARTVTVLRMLDSVRRGSLIRFLSQTGILSKCIELELEGIDLSRADLTHINLSKINLNFANLTEANLEGAKLNGAFLMEAKLNGAFLFQANLTGANLVGASLSQAHLGGANLTDAYLSFASLSDDEIKEALMPYLTQGGITLRKEALFSEIRDSRVVLNGTFLEEANLKGAIGITTEELEKQAKSLKGATMPDGSIHP